MPGRLAAPAPGAGGLEPGLRTEIGITVRNPLFGPGLPDVASARGSHLGVAIRVLRAGLDEASSAGFGNGN